MRPISAGPRTSALILALAAAATPLPLQARTPAAATATTPDPAGSQPAPGAQVQPRPRALLVTFGPGAAVWERFGHNALWIHDPDTRVDYAYHYGLFDMSQQGFMFEFLQGRMFYTMGRDPALRMIELYRRYGRSARVQELDLTDAQTRRLRDFLEWNWLPENRGYRYDYFRDNCSTRIRDALDHALDGALRERLAPLPSPMTYREQAVALTAGDALLTTGMDLGLGPLADQPISRWDLAFIPMRLADELDALTVARDGAPLPLVRSGRVLPAFGQPDADLSARRHETSPRLRALWLLLLGTAVGGGLALAGRAAGGRSGPRAPEGSGQVGGSRGRTRRIGAWVVQLGVVLWGLLSGTLGLILLALWTLTDHEFAWRNENLLQTNPLALAFVVLVPLAAIRATRTVGGVGTAGAASPAGASVDRDPAAARWRRARQLASVLLGASVGGLVLHFLPVTRHANLPIIALVLPIHLGVWHALHRMPGSG